LRVLSVVHGFPPEQIGGTQVNAYHVSKRVSKKCDLVVFTRDFDPSRKDCEEYVETIDGIRIYRINSVNTPRPFSYSYLDPRVTDAFDRVVRRFRPEVVHFAHVIDLSTEMIRRAKEHGLPVILTLQDFFFVCHRIYLIDINQNLCSGPEDGAKCANCIRPDALSDIELWRTQGKPELNDLSHETDLLRQLGRERLDYMLATLRVPDLILCPSEFMKASFTGFGIPAEKIHISAPGIDKSFLSQIRSPCPGGVMRVRFGFIGPISYHKGLHTLIDAITFLPRHRATLEVFGGGNSKYSDDLRSKAINYGVHFHNPYSYEEMGEAFSSFDVLVVPAIVHESYSLVIREALAAGRPIIVSNLRSQMDFVRDGVDGFHFQVENARDLSEKMQRFIKDPSLIMTLGRTHLPIRDVDDQATELMQIYWSLARSRNIGEEANESKRKQSEREGDAGDPWEREWTLREALEQQRKENIRLVAELTQRHNELAAIRSSLGYRFMRFYAARIDRLFPVGTKRGSLRQQLTNRIASRTEDAPRQK
jgi:glycosyltransferase involved in cell wall biosynthesis